MIRVRGVALVGILLVAAGTAFAHGDHPPFESVEKAVAVLHATRGQGASGTVTFSESRRGVMVRARIQGLSPGRHGFHVHEWGDCTAPDAASAGGHFDPWETQHGSPDAPPAGRHAGDLGNLEAGPDGTAEVLRLVEGLSLQGFHTLLGRSVIVHAGADDLTSQPAGNAGPRVACGVIGVARP